MFKSASSIADTIKASPQHSDLVNSPFNKRLSATMFDYYRTKPEHAARFAKAMAGVTASKYTTSFSPCLCWQAFPTEATDKPPTLSEIFPWHTLHGTVVDVSGGSGHVSFALARRFPQLSFRVQDSEEMLRWRSTLAQVRT